MANHTADISWERQGDQAENLLVYSRNHSWTFDNGLTVAASGAPEFKGDAACVDPEEAFVAAVSSCHMLSFIWIAVQDGFCPTHYEDAAVGRLQKNNEGKLAVTDITLHPKTCWRSDKQPSHDQIKDLHHKAHEACFIANSVKSKINIQL